MSLSWASTLMSLVKLHPDEYIVSYLDESPVNLHFDELPPWWVSPVTSESMVSLLPGIYRRGQEPLVGRVEVSTLSSAGGTKLPMDEVSAHVMVRQ